MTNCFLFTLSLIASLQLFFITRFALCKKTKDLILAIFFGLQSFLLFSRVELHQISLGQISVLLICAATGAAAAFLCRHKSLLNSMKDSKSIGIAFASSTASILFIITYLYSLLFQLTDDKAILKITLTGKTEQRLVEWKTPHSSLQKQEMTCYEVIISDLTDDPIFQGYMYGDLCAVRCKIIRLHPLLNRLGFSNLYLIDTLYNGYRTAEQYQQFPVAAVSIASTSSFSNLFWKLWSKNFSSYYTSKWIKSATLESNYFPLTQSPLKPYCGAFLLTVTPGGLSSLPLKQ